MKSRFVTLDNLSFAFPDIEKLVTDRFVKARTPYANLAEMMMLSGVSKDELNLEQFDEFVMRHTQFESWYDLVVTALEYRANGAAH